MTAVTFLGVTADPEQLREIAEAVDAGAPDWRQQVDALPLNVLGRKVPASPSAVIAERLRACAEFLERRRAGVPWGGCELAAELAKRGAGAPQARAATTGPTRPGRS